MAIIYTTKSNYTYIHCTTAASLQELAIAITGSMSTSGSPSKSPKGKSSGRGNGKRKKTTGGGRNRDSDRRAGSRRTTVFKTDSIGISPNDIAKATSTATGLSKTGH